ncbi:Gfo/Idh/MocA family oxidoreductase [Sulfidibacter corallicola]|uniref:Gfo/Idh/MocA family oxidoreductase n=1 Tax=Sulfidibacter corallicola TaxID=2818388 RepID=A0A8A4TFT4_SULCO|nr:Gfo/Idh/MocA family oxidoreductase [Sulfidibacter corallicola]QTD48064.1 Gfo/Idh/MocA family oxidoreductase [Sulfidibacter corallicola]
MGDRIKVGVIGVGALGRHHARLYKQIDECELVGVYDLNQAQAEKIAEEVGTRVYADPSVLADEVEGLSIAVPTNHHFEVAMSMLEMGKHLLIEKPITQTIEEAESLLKAADERKRIIQVGHVERFNPVISYLEEKINNPRFIESHRLSSYPPPRPGLPPRGTEVGVVLDLMIHDIDMVLNLVKSPVKEIDAVGVPVLSPTEDIANARLKFENGCVANLTASRVTPEPLRKIRLFQGDCYLSLDYMAKTGEIYVKRDKGITREAVPVNDHNALLKQLEDFVSCITTLRDEGVMPKPRVSGEHGMRALEIAVEISKLCQNGFL